MPRKKGQWAWDSKLSQWENYKNAAEERRQIYQNRDKAWMLSHPPSPGHGYSLFKVATASFAVYMATQIYDAKQKREENDKEDCN